MIYLALAELVVLEVVVLAFAGLLRSQSRAFARREDILVNQIMHLSGRTWTPPPQAERPASEPRTVPYSVSPPSEVA